jgi:hypothetical protein
MNPKLDIEGKSKAQLLKEAQDLLLASGYIVRPPIQLSTTVKTPGQLVKFFYGKLAYYNPEFSMIYDGDKKRDLAIAKKFIEARRESGMSRPRAIQECCNLIEFLFANEKGLELTYKVTSMVVLGQDKMAWFTDKLITAYNGYNIGVEKIKEQVWQENLYNEQELKVNKELVETANRRLGLEKE